MPVNEMLKVDEILNAAKKGAVLSKEEALSLLNIENSSPEYYRLLETANYLTRKEYENKGLIFVQIGINAEPCSKNCKFCAMGKDHYSLENTWRKNMDEILSEVKILINEGIDDLFVMTTADYPLEELLKIVRKIKEILPKNRKVVANIGDFDFEDAKKLKEAGFDGMYHINRLREGIDTPIPTETRVKTLNAMKEAGLELYYCVEPIGPEHTYDELVTEMLRARDFGVKVMAVMRRIPVPGTPLYESGQISAVELTKIVAVARIVSRPSRAMNAHEVTPMTLLAGVNQLYAEIGANPRDNSSNTETSRGSSVPGIRKLLLDAEYSL